MLRPEGDMTRGVMRNGTGRHAWSLLVATALAVGVPCGLQAAEDEEEERADFGSYQTSSRQRPAVEAPEMEVERPEMTTDFQIEIAPPAARVATPVLTLDQAMIAPTPAPAQQTAPQTQPQQAPPQRQQSSAPPSQQPSQRPATSPPQRQPETTTATPPQRRQPAASSGPRVVPISMDAPRYPREAYLDGTEGQVTVEFTILPDGSVEDVEIVAETPRGVFGRDAVRAVRRWTFQPMPSQVRLQHTIDFTMD